MGGEIVPASTDRLGDTDIYIRKLAYELDGLLGSGYIFATYAGSLTPDNNGMCDVPFPLSKIVGAIVQVSSTMTLNTGIPAYYDPIPPATIGIYIGNTGFQPFLNTIDISPGVVRVWIRTTTSQKNQSGTNIGYGSRTAGVGGAPVPFVGLAWGNA